MEKFNAGQYFEREIKKKFLNDDQTASKNSKSISNLRNLNTSPLTKKNKLPQNLNLNFKNLRKLKDENIIERTPEKDVSSERSSFIEKFKQKIDLSSSSIHMLKESSTLQSSQFLKNLVLDSKQNSIRNFSQQNEHYFESISGDRYEHLSSMNRRIESEDEQDVSTGLERSDYFHSNSNNNLELLKNMNIELSTKASTPPQIKLKVPDQFDQFFIYFDSVEMKRKHDRPQIDFTPNGGIGFVPTQSNLPRSRITHSNFAGSSNSIFRSNFNDTNSNSISSSHLVGRNRKQSTPQTLEFQLKNQVFNNEQSTKRKTGFLSSKPIETSQFSVEKYSHVVSGQEAVEKYPDYDNKRRNTALERGHQKSYNPFFQNKVTRSPLSKIKEQYLRDSSENNLRHRRIKSNLSYTQEHKSMSNLHGGYNLIDERSSTNVFKTKNTFENALRFKSKTPNSNLYSNIRRRKMEEFSNEPTHYQQGSHFRTNLFKSNVKKSLTPNSLSRNQSLSQSKFERSLERLENVKNRFRTPKVGSYREKLYQKTYRRNRSGSRHVQSYHSRNMSNEKSRSPLRSEYNSVMEKLEHSRYSRDVSQVSHSQIDYNRPKMIDFEDEDDCEEIAEIIFSSLTKSKIEEIKLRSKRPLQQESIEERINLIPLVTSEVVQAQRKSGSMASQKTVVECDREQTKHFKIVENFKKGYYRRHKSTGRSGQKTEKKQRSHQRSISSINIDFSKYANFEEFKIKQLQGDQSDPGMLDLTPKDVKI